MTRLACSCVIGLVFWACLGLVLFQRLILTVIAEQGPTTPTARRIAAALTLNISKGGLAIRTMSPLQQDAKLRVRFRLPGSKRDIEAESRVAWSDRRVGMGLQFEKVDPADQAKVDEFVDQHFFSNRKA